MATGENRGLLGWDQPATLLSISLWMAFFEEKLISDIPGLVAYFYNSAIYFKAF